jgi:hypothetical protein
MPPHWLHDLSIASLAAAAFCTIAIALDLVRRPQKMGIMNVTWPITALYFGVFGLWAYYAFGCEAQPEKEQPHKKEQPHEKEKQPEKPFWQTVFVGVTHCGGCTLGDIAAEWTVFGLGWTIAGVML